MSLREKELFSSELSIGRHCCPLSATERLFSIAALMVADGRVEVAVSDESEQVSPNLSRLYVVLDRVGMNLNYACNERQTLMACQSPP